MKLLVAGDLAITNQYSSYNIGDKIKKLFKSSNHNIVNLEAPVTNSSHKILKTGPHLKSSSESTLNVLKELNIDIVTLANNHILDYDQAGLKDTLNFCDKADIATLGAGVNIKDAKNPLFINTPNGQIAILNFAENEWSSASNNEGGANPLDIIENTYQIKKVKREAKYVFVIIHGGHEYYNLPSPRMKKQYRFYAEHGADLIISHHTHCVSGYEVYNKVPIYYGLGNFLFTNHSQFSDWYAGLIIEICFDKNGQLKTTPIPVSQKKSNFYLELLNGDERKTVLERFQVYSDIIANDDILNEHWSRYVGEETKNYLKMLSPKAFIKNKYIRGVLNKSGINLNNKFGNSLLLNLLRCEAHRDLSIEVLEDYLNKNPKM